jgi:speckle-type POZ protein
VATTSLAPCASVEYEWRVDGVTKEFFTAAAVSHKLESAPFSAHGFEWCLELYPNGEIAEDRGNISLFLRLRTQKTTATPMVTLRAGAEPERQLGADKIFSTHKPDERSFSVWGFGEYLAHDELLADFEARVPGGVFTVTAVLRLPGIEARTNPIDVPAPNPTAGWGALLASGKDADVTLLCGGERIAAHRLVLCMRSPVFAAQLDAGPLQADAAAVPVPPEITPHTLHRLLEFIYTDELEPSSPEEATHLLNAADHYGLRRLFCICERTLCAALCFENAAETLTLADQHSAAALKDAALRFVAKNALAVMATVGWAHLQSSRPALITEALHTLAAGVPPLPQARPAAAADAGGDAGAAGTSNEGATQRPRKRAR